jgi:hypothetical protein
MPQPDLTVLAEGDLPTGQHWMLRAGGTTEDFYTFLETIHADGHRDSGGMGGPLLYPGTLLPQTAGLASITAADADGCPLEPQDLSRHEAGWQRFLRRQTAGRTDATRSRWLSCASDGGPNTGPSTQTRQAARQSPRGPATLPDKPRHKPRQAARQVNRLYFESR